MYSLRMSFCTVPGQLPDRDSLALADRDVERQQDDRGGVDGHRRGHAVERNAVEERGHVVDRVDGDADPADLAGGQRGIRVVADLRREVERDAEAADALGQQIAIALVGLRRRPKPGVLPHRPQPAPVHRRLDAPGEREGPGEAEVAVGVEPLQVARHREVPGCWRRGHGRHCNARRHLGLLPNAPASAASPAVPPSYRKSATYCVVLLDSY